MLLFLMVLHEITGIVKNVCTGGTPYHFYVQKQSLEKEISKSYSAD